MQIDRFHERDHHPGTDPRSDLLEGVSRLALPFARDE